MDDWNTLKSRWSFPTTVWFGAGRAAELPAAVRELGVSRPLLITDRGLASHPMVEAAIQTLRNAGMQPGLFSDIKPNPSGQNVADGVAALRAGQHDSVIAFGGGSAMDAAKAVALMSGQTRQIWDFEDVGDNWRRVEPAGMLPVVALPTTAGTGSELGRSSVITNEEEARKVIIFHPGMLPGLVILDPLLTIGLPPVLTAATGMDALSHAIEAFSAPGFHPMADGLALMALKLVHDWLPVAYAEPANVEARAKMLTASAMACVALQKGLGAIHALAHPLGARYDAHHGMINAVLMPYVLRHNAPHLQEKFATLQRWLDLSGTTPEEAVLGWILDLRRRLDIPETLSGMGITIQPADLPDLIGAALQDPCAAGNPVPLTAEAVDRLLRTAA